MRPSGFCRLQRIYQPASTVAVCGFSINADTAPHLQTCIETLHPILRSEKQSTSSSDQPCKPLTQAPNPKFLQSLLPTRSQKDDHENRQRLKSPNSNNRQTDRDDLTAGVFMVQVFCVRSATLSHNIFYLYTIEAVAATTRTNLVKVRVVQNGISDLQVASGFPISLHRLDPPKEATPSKQRFTVIHNSG